MGNRPSSRTPIRRPPASAGAPFTVALDAGASEPLFRQLYQAIRSAILAGSLKPGAKMPSTRVLAAELSISRNTAALAYDYLQAEGFLTAGIGSGTYVNRDLNFAQGAPRLATVPRGPETRLSRLAESITQIRSAAPLRSGPPRPFRLGEPALDMFPIESWSRLLRGHAKRAGNELLSYGAVQGYRHLRTAVLEHVRAARGVRAALEQVFLVRGAQQAVDLIARALLNPGDAVWVEDPGYPVSRAIAEANGARLIPVPVDHEGLIVEEGLRRDADARAVFVTPSHHNPLGATLSLQRRLQLLDWARTRSAWIIEDDYDSEFRYSGRPLPSLQGLDRQGHVLYIGTFSKTMFPALRLGYLIVPQQLVPVFEHMRDRFDVLSPNVEQAALADFIVRGDYARHVRRMRALYRDRQSCLVTEMRALLSEWLTVNPAETGLQIIAWLRAGLSEQDAAQAAGSAGVEVRPLSIYALEQQLPPALVMGFAAYPEASLCAAVRRLAAALRALERTARITV